MGVQAIAYYMVTTIIAVFTGIIVVVLLKPGKGTRDTSVSSGGNIEAVQTMDAFMDLIRCSTKAFEYPMLLHSLHFIWLSITSIKSIKLQPKLRLPFCSLEIWSPQI